jgi:hypothetical protein
MQREGCLRPELKQVMLGWQLVSAAAGFPAC